MIARVLGDRRLDCRGVNQTVGADVDRDRRGAGVVDGLGRGDEGVRGQDNLGARADPHGAQAEQHGVGAVRNADRKADAYNASQFGFKLVHVALQDEAPARTYVIKNL